MPHHPINANLFLVDRFYSPFAHFIINHRVLHILKRVCPQTANERKTIKEFYDDCKMYSLVLSQWHIYCTVADIKLKAYCMRGRVH